MKGKAVAGNLDGNDLGTVRNGNAFGIFSGCGIVDPVHAVDDSGEHRCQSQDHRQAGYQNQAPQALLQALCRRVEGFFNTGIAVRINHERTTW